MTDEKNTFSESIESNKRLCEKYPWLIPSEDKNDPKYDYTYTLLDQVETGWVKAFGDELCEDIEKARLKLDAEDQKDFEFRAKEKWGALRLDFYPYNVELNKISEKYEALSKRYCGICGEPATRITTGWIYPACDNCLKEYESVPISEYLGE